MLFLAVLGGGTIALGTASRLAGEGLLGRAIAVAGGWAPAGGGVEQLWTQRRCTRSYIFGRVGHPLGQQPGV